MIGSTVLALILTHQPLPAPDAVGANTGATSDVPSTVPALSFLVGEWSATFETFEGAFGSSAGRSSGSVRGTFGPGNEWLELEATTELSGVGAYVVRVLVHASPAGDGYRAYVVNTFGGGLPYEGAFLDDSTLVFTAPVGDRIQRVTYTDLASGAVDFRVDESTDGGATFHAHSAARWTPRSSDAGADIAAIAHIEVQVDDAARALRFYEGVFEWPFTRWTGPSPYWSAEPGAGSGSASIGLMPRTQPRVPPVFTVYVPSISSALERAVDLGGRISQETTAVPGVGWQAYLEDSEGNPFALFELDPEAR